MNVLVSGSRSIKDREMIANTLTEALPKADDLTVIVGGAIGIDQAVADYCIENHIDVDIVFADWNTHGKPAGMIRNVEMLTIYDPGELLVIWDGVSRGTQHTLLEGLKRRLDTTVSIIGDDDAAGN
jgi:hypothetical protein